MKKLIGAVLALLAVGGFAAYRMRAGGERDLKSFFVKLGDIKKTVEAGGVVEPKNSVEILPPISGRLDRLLVDQGQRVEKGAVLAWMSSADRAAVLDAALSQSPEAYEKWEKTYRPTPIVAPVAGLIIQRDVVEGQTVASGKKLFVMADRLIVRARVDESEIGKIRIGQSVEVVADAFPDKPFEAKVRLIDYQSKNVSGVSAFTVELEPRGLPPELRSGMTARANFYIDLKTSIPLLPVSAAPGVEGQTLELKVKRERAAITVPVKLGISDGSSIEIVEGLKVGEEVLVEAPTDAEPKKNPFDPFSGRRGPRGARGRAH